MTAEQFQQFANLLPDACLLVTAEGEIVAANRSARRTLLADRERSESDSLFGLVDDPAESACEYLRLCARSRQPVVGALTIRGTIYRCEGGVLQPRSAGSAARLLLRMAPRDASAARFVALNERIEQLNREIVRRRRVEDELDRARERLQVTLMSIGDAVITTDAWGHIQLMNPVAEQLTGWRQAEAQGRPLDEVFRIINEDTRHTVESPVARVLREGRIVGLANHTLLVHRDDTERPIDDSGAPIRDRDGSLAGVVLVFRDVTDRRHSERQLRSLNESLEQRVAERTAVAEHRARQLQALAVEVTQAEQRERRRLGVILHDTVQQMIVAAKMQLAMVRARSPEDAAEPLNQVGDVLQQAIDATRTLAIDLAPPVLYDAGLAAALRWLARWAEAHWGLAVEIRVDGRTEPEDIDTSAFLLQAVRELLLNVLKHSGASEAHVVMSNPSPAELELAVSDGGRGFPPAEADRETGDQFGLLSIRERLERLRGEMLIESIPGSGATIRLICPVHSDAPAGRESTQERPT